MKRFILLFSLFITFGSSAQDEALLKFRTTEMGQGNPIKKIGPTYPANINWYVYKDSIVQKYLDKKQVKAMKKAGTSPRITFPIQVEDRGNNFVGQNDNLKFTISKGKRSVIFQSRDNFTGESQTIYYLNLK